ncbi:uncharacterized protein FA14DRAFT_162604 [Meira miltonrushii]|uniref:Uncharacterized protein n=1 Tax=Meira miltonrushii TaxID=1280837 RepID=A0A316V633_9BASI|nr:uncharacterized protein FA14DRAFT_162604 [Meira miltonrushii]PWN31663.1 hypothetical protein FA14DRAFT_162604 [Meira miltonrushii]
MHHFAARVPEIRIKTFFIGWIFIDCSFWKRKTLGLFCNKCSHAVFGVRLLIQDSYVLGACIVAYFYSM